VVEEEKAEENGREEEDEEERGDSSETAAIPGDVSKDGPGESETKEDKGSVAAPSAASSTNGGKSQCAGIVSRISVFT